MQEGDKHSNPRELSHQFEHWKLQDMGGSGPSFQGDSQEVTSGPTGPSMHDCISQQKGTALEPTEVTCPTGLHLPDEAA